MCIRDRVTLVQLFSIGPVGGQVPIIMGTSSGFLGVFNSVAASMGGGVLAYGAIMGASILGGLFETVLGFFQMCIRDRPHAKRLGQKKLVARAAGIVGRQAVRVYQTGHRQAVLLSLIHIWSTSATLNPLVTG